MMPNVGFEPTAASVPLAVASGRWPQPQLKPIKSVCSFDFCATAFGSSDLPLRVVSTRLHS